MALLMSTELASSAAAAALNSASRPLSAALVASTASCTCSPRRRSSAERSAAALVEADGFIATCVVVPWSALAVEPVSATADMARAKMPMRELDTMMSLLSIPDQLAGRWPIGGCAIRLASAADRCRPITVSPYSGWCGRRVALSPLLRDGPNHGCRRRNDFLAVGRHAHVDVTGAEPVTGWERRG